MMKCKVAIDDKNECTNCCYLCDKKDTCNDVCQDIAKVCEEQVEETDLQVIESTVPDVLKAITDITVQRDNIIYHLLQETFKNSLLGVFVLP